MRTTITIDDHLFCELLRYSDTRSKSAAVSRAIEEWLADKKIRELRALRGKLDIIDNIAALRELELGEGDTNG